MKIISLFCAFLFLGSIARADMQTDWMNLLNQVVTQGTVLENQFNQTRYLSKVVPSDISKPHKAYYATVAGSEDIDGTFSLQQVSLVEEDWQLRANGDWYVDQWFAYVAPNGVVTELAHQAVTKTAGGKSTLDRFPNPAPADMQAKWKEMIGVWIAP